MDEHGIDVHCLVPLPWLECEPALHANETKALEVWNEEVKLYQVSLNVFITDSNNTHVLYVLQRHHLRAAFEPRNVDCAEIIFSLLV